MKKYDNFVKAFQNLQDIYLYEPPYSNAEKTDIIRCFRI